MLFTICFSGALTLPAGAGKPQAQAASPAAELAGKARALDLRGRYELARQTWEQVLQMDPENAEALGGVIHCLRAEGREREATQYLERARAAHPGNAGWAQLPASGGGESKSAELREAEQLSRKGRFAEAMVLYRRLYGAQPPAGEVSLAYYAAEGASEEGRPQAIAGLRALSDRFPDDPRYRRALGSLLVLNTRTRGEGQTLLAGGTARKSTVLLAGTSTPPPMPARAANAAATVGLRADATTTSVPGPVSAAVAQVSVPTADATAPSVADTSLRAAVQPGAPVLPAQGKPAANQVQAQESQPALVPAESTLTHSQPLSLAAAPSPPKPASPAGKAPEANTAVAQPPSSALGRLASQAQGSTADGEMERAGFAALSAGRVHDAEAKFKVLLARNGDNARASGGLGLVRLRQANWSEAIPLLERAERNEPANSAFARGLRQAQAATRSPASAAVDAAPQETASRESVAVALHTPSRRAPETRSLTALALPRRVPGAAFGAASEGNPVPAASLEAKLSRAAALAASGDDRSAGALFEEVTAVDARQTSAWAGLITSLQRQRKDAEALSLIDRMPRDVLQAALQMPEFAVSVAALEEEGGRAAAARQVLESLLAQAPQPPGKNYAAAQLQLGHLLLQEGQPAQAYGLFRASVANAPESLEAWAGLMAALHATGHDREALEQLSAVPPALRVQMESNPLFLATAPLLYAGVNDNANALAYWSRLQQFAAAEHTAVTPTLSLQQAEWLGRVGDEPRLYEALMGLGKRSDLSDAQRRSVQQVWAEWAIRQATQQARNGNSGRAAGILNAAATAFADNAELQRTLALGYASASLPRNAVALLRTQDLSNASALDLRAAVNAALTIRDEKQAELWLRPALVHYPGDPDLLLLASRFETQAGRKRESAAYYQAALGAAEARQRALPSGTGEQPKLAEPGVMASAPGSSPDLATIFAGAGAARTKPTQLSSADGARPYLPGSAPSAGAFQRRGPDVQVSR